MLKSQIDQLSRVVGIPSDQLIAALCLFLSFPFAIIYNLLLKWRGAGKAGCGSWFTWINLMVSAGPTFYFLYISYFLSRDGQVNQLPAFLFDVFSLLLPPLVMYAALKTSKWARGHPTAIFSGLLIYLSYHHLSRQINFYNQYVVNVTTPMMVTVIRLSAFAYNVHDGKIDMKAVGFVNFFAWAWMFAGYFTGPVVHYSDYMTLIAGKSRPDSKSAGRKRRVMFLLLTAALMTSLTLVLKARFPPERLLEVTEAKAQEPLWYRLLFMHLSLFNWRTKYYLAWLLAETAIVLIGFGSHNRPHKTKVTWDKYQNINPLVIETSCDFRTIIAEWNVSTNRWLNEYVYQRLGRTASANIITYMVSAFWHGFYPGYYLTFIAGALYTLLCRQIFRQCTWPLPASLRQPLLFIPNYLLVNYFAAAFSLQTFQAAWRFYRATYFYGHIVMALGFLAMMILGAASKKTHHKKD